MPADPIASPKLSHVGSPGELWESPARERLETEILPAFVRGQRWFGGKARPLSRVALVDQVRLLPETEKEHPRWLAFFDFHFADGGTDRYCLPLVIDGRPEQIAFLESLPHRVIARLTGGPQPALLFDGAVDPITCTALMEMIGTAARVPTQRGHLRGDATEAFTLLRGGTTEPLPPSPGPAGSSNSLVFYGERMLLKLFRRLEPGVNPDYEIGRFLTERSEFRQLPLVAGQLEHTLSDGDETSPGDTFTVALLEARVPHDADGWSDALNRLSQYFAGEKTVPAEDTDAAAMLGRRTAEMHRALAGDVDDPDFRPEPLTRADLDRLREDIAFQAQLAFAAIAERRTTLDPQTQRASECLLAEGPKQVRGYLARLETEPVPAAMKTRIHGDYHLGQVLRTGEDYVLLDF